MRKWKILKHLVATLVVFMVAGIIGLWCVFSWEQSALLALRWKFIVIPWQPYILIGIVIVVGGWLYRVCDSRIKIYS